MDTPAARGARRRQGHSYPAIRTWLRHRVVRAVIPKRADRPRRALQFDREAYRRRSAIECKVAR